MGKGILDWVVAVVAVATLMCGGIGIYVGLTNNINVFASQMVDIRKDVDDNANYDIYLQEQVDSLKDKVTRLEVLIEVSDKEDKELKSLLEDLRKELQDMRAELLLRKG